MMLSCLQATLNNFIKYSFINLSSNQILFKFCMHKTLNLICIKKSDVVKIAADIADSVNNSVKHIKLTVMNQYKSAHIDVKNTIVFTIICIKTYYNKIHQSLFFNEEDIINLQLHHKYILSSLID